MPKRTVSIRLPDELLQWADSLIGKAKLVKDMPAIGAAERRSEVLRIAIMRGLMQLEEENEHDET